MPKLILLFLTAFLLTQSTAQKIYFPASNLSDSVAIKNNMPLLAKQAIAVYKEADKKTYFDNLFRLQLVAQQYDVVESTMTQLALVSFGDTVTTKPLGFAYKMYIATLQQHPAAADFDSTYKRAFMAAYNSYSADGKSWAERYFANDVEAMKQTWQTKLRQAQHADSITIADAVSLCRNYCSMLTYTTTNGLANHLLKAIENDLYITNDSVLLKMPDGGTVSLTVVRSRKITTPQPVVLVYNIYVGKDMTGPCKEAVSHGYVGIVADTRGKRLSPDSIVPFEYDGKDAYYIIDWISKQPWCNGKVGMYGGSYLGFAQWSAAKYLHPALKTIVPQVSVGAGIDYPQMNGVYMNFMLRWIHFVTNNKHTDNAEFSNTEKWNDLYKNWYQKGRSFRSLDTLEGRPNAIFQRWLSHPQYDSYWQKMTPQKNEFAKIDIPILTTTGYWDDDQTGAMYYYKQYHKWNKNSNYYLLIGPYDHGGSQGYPKLTLSGYAIDSVANVPIAELVFKWFDYVLKDSARPAMLKDKVNYEVMGANEWRHAPSLDKMHNDTLTLYLGMKGNNNHYSLVKKKPVMVSYIAQTVDMKDRSELRFINEDVSFYGQVEDSVLNPSKEHLLFASEPLDKPLVISGSLTASLMASVNKKDIDIALRLYEQTPEGKYIALNENLQRASYSNQDSVRHLLQPGKVQRIEMKNTFITCRQLRKGSRIIITLGVNKNPNWQINYGTGKDVSDETMADAAEPFKIKWYGGSWVKLLVQ